LEEGIFVEKRDLNFAEVLIDFILKLCGFIDEKLNLRELAKV
jgi:hypothetical protein